MELTIDRPNSNIDNWNERWRSYHQNSQFRFITHEILIVKGDF